MRPLLSFVVAALLIPVSSGETYAQVFVNDNDGLLDVGEAPGFPEDPAVATEILNMGNQGIQDLDGVSLLSNLQSLDLSRNRILGIDFGDFKGLANLETLYLGSNEITSIEPDDFDGLSNLETLHLSANPIVNINEDHLAELDALRTLHLNNTRITNLGSGDFDQLSNLQTLDLGCNTIANIEARAFDGLPNLRELFLDGCSGRFLCAPSFCGHSISSIESGAFAGLRNLETLLLTDAGLTTLNLSSATFDQLMPGAVYESRRWGFFVDGDEVSSLTLDYAELSLGSFDAIVRATYSVVDVSLIGLTFSDELPDDLSALLGIETLDSVRVDPALHDRYADEFDAFAAFDGNTVTVIPEPSSIFMGFLTVCCGLSRISRRLPRIPFSKTTALLCVVWMCAAFNCKAHAQAFVDDNDGQLDVGEAPGFPDDPASATDELDLHGLGIQDLDGTKLLSSLESLHLGRNSIASIERGDFHGLTELKALNLEQNSISSIESGGFSGMHELQTLDLWNNEISSFDPAAFEGLANLRLLHLGDNSISSIERGDFEGLPNLQTLHLWRNGISTIESGDFNGLSNLQWLDLRGNAIASIESGDFDGLSDLETLSLDGNRIVSIEPAGLDGLTKLQLLRLDGNAVASIGAVNLNALASLQSLSLRGNSISTIEPGDFAGLTHVLSLDLTENGISTIKAGDFNGLNHLQSLTLDFNSLQSIQPGGFSGLSSLLTLSLDFTSIVSIEAGMFEGLANLEILYLGSNFIERIEPEGLDGLPNLRELHFGGANGGSFCFPDVYCGNRLTSIEQDDFCGLTSLELLNLSLNEIVRIESAAFAGLRDLETLLLHGNPLTELNLTSATFDNLKPASCSLFGSCAGFTVNGQDITSLTLDQAELSTGSFVVILDRTTTILDASIIGLKFTDEPPADLSALLGIPTLDNVRVDPSLYSRYAAQFDAFAAIPGNSVTVVPEPSSMALLLLLGLATPHQIARLHRFSNMP